MSHVIKKLPMGVADKALYYRINNNRADWTESKALALKYHNVNDADYAMLVLKHRSCIRGQLEVVPV